MPAPSRPPIPGSLSSSGQHSSTAERGTYFATYRGPFVGPEPALESEAGAIAAVIPS